MHIAILAIVTIIATVILVGQYIVLARGGDTEEPDA